MVGQNLSVLITQVTTHTTLTLVPQIPTQVVVEILVTLRLVPATLAVELLVTLLQVPLMQVP